MDILLFSTTIDTASDIAAITPLLNELEAIHQWTVDTNDCDKVLRIVCDRDIAARVELILYQLGYTCQRMPLHLQNEW